MKLYKRVTLLLNITFPFNKNKITSSSSSSFSILLLQCVLQLQKLGLRKRLRPLICISGPHLRPLQVLYLRSINLVYPFYIFLRIFSILLNVFSSHIHNWLGRGLVNLHFYAPPTFVKNKL